MADVFTLEHTTPLEHGNRLANLGYSFNCRACGKKSRDMYGNHPISWGWDESCALNCVLIKDCEPPPETAYAKAE